MKDKSNITPAIVLIGKNKNIQLVPRQDFEVFTEPDNNNFRVEWHTNKMAAPTVAEIEAAENSAISESQRLAYVDKRKTAYPSIAEQLDMMWHYIKQRRMHGVDDMGLFDSWFDNIKAIKDRYPKP